MTDSTSDDDDDRIGYGRPPKSTRWKKGQSGNPTGRRPGAPSLKTAIGDELKATILISDSSGRREVSKMEALAKRLVADALNGEPRMLIELLRQVNIHLAEPAAGDASLPASDEDAELLLDYVRRAAAAQTQTSTKGQNDGAVSDKF